MDSNRSRIAGLLADEGLGPCNNQDVQEYSSTPLAPDGSEGSPGNVREKESTVGTRNGRSWIPAECDVSIRPGWFWHEAENSKVKSPRQLLDLYYASAGRGASFLLNVPPDRRGRIHEADGESLREFGRLLHQTFASNLAVGAAIEASNQRGHDPAFAPAHLLDGSRRTYWATDDGLPTSTVTVRFRQPTTFNLVRLREYIQLGQRVDSFELETRQGSEWTPFGRGTSVGIGRIIKSEKPVVADALRLRLTSQKACPALSELSVHRKA